VVDTGVKSHHDIEGALDYGEIHDETFGLRSFRAAATAVPLMETTYIIRI
jgi:hypothetical protein